MPIPLQEDHRQRQEELSALDAEQRLGSTSGGDWSPEMQQPEQGPAQGFGTSYEQGPMPQQAQTAQSMAPIPTSYQQPPPGYQQAQEMRPEAQPGFSPLNSGEGSHMRGYLAAQQALSAAQLSPGERTRSQELRNAMSDIQQRLDLGWISPSEAMQLQHEVGAAGHPLWVRESQIPGLAMQLQFETMRNQAAQQTAIQNEDATARAQRVRDHTVTLEDGTRIYIDPERRTHIIAAPADHSSQVATRQAAEDRHIDQLEHQHNTLANQIRTRVQREYDQAMRPRQAGESSAEFQARRAPEWLNHTVGQPGLTIGPVALRVQQELAEHYASTGNPSPVERIQAHRQRRQIGPSPAAPNGSTPASEPTASTQPQMPFDPARPESMTTQQRTIHQSFETQRATIDAMPVSATRRTELQTMRGEAQQLMQQYGSVPNMQRENPIAYARYLAIVQQIQHAAQAPPRPGQIQPPLR